MPIIYQYLGFNFTVDDSNFNIFKILRTAVNILCGVPILFILNAKPSIAIFRLDIRVLAYDGVLVTAFLLRMFRPAYAPLLAAAVLLSLPVDRCPIRIGVGSRTHC